MLKKALLPLLFCGMLFTAAAEEAKVARYVFYFAADGMTAETLRAAREAGKESAATAMLDALPVRGASATADNGDLPAAATALACAVKTASGMTAVTPDGERRDSIVKLAKMQGRKTAVVADGALNSAIPAAFYAHSQTSGNGEKIARFLPVSPVDFFGGGHFAASDGVRAEIEKALTDVGYSIIKNPADLRQIAAEDLPLIATDDSTAIAAPGRIAGYTARAAALLADHPEGFLIVTAAASLPELNRAVGKALDFYYEFPAGTVIVVAAVNRTAPVLALGRGTEIFAGEYPDTEIPRKLFKLMGIIDPTE